jgi:transcriptional regulator with XRE-family HTH domain
MLSHKDLRDKMLQNPDVQKEFAKQEEFSLFDQLIQARMEAGLTQSEVAERMGTTTPAVARLESGGGMKQHSPCISTLRKYARAVGCNLEIKLVQSNCSIKRKGPNISPHYNPNSVLVFIR